MNAPLRPLTDETVRRATAEDVPRLVAAAALAHPRMRVRVTEATGSVAGIADLILATVPSD